LWPNRNNYYARATGKRGPIQDQGGTVNSLFTKTRKKAQREERKRIVAFWKERRRHHLRKKTRKEHTTKSRSILRQKEKSEGGKPVNRQETRGVAG